MIEFKIETKLCHLDNRYDNLAELNKKLQEGYIIDVVQCVRVDPNDIESEVIFYLHKV